MVILDLCLSYLKVSTWGSRLLPLSMLKTLSYINLSLGTLYFLLWLQQGSYYAITGVVIIILFCIYTLRMFDAGKWSKLRFFIAFPITMISGWLTSSGMNLICSNLNHGGQNGQIIFLCGYCLVFGFTLFVQVILLGLKNNSSTV